MPTRPSSLPPFSSLPLNKDDPPYSAWGLYGKHDQLGFLNRQTDEVVAEAAKEIKTGVRVSMNWPLDTNAKSPLFGRQAFHMELINKSPRVVNDDVWTFNTQSSSQWDGLRHFGYQKQAKFYNGVTMDDIHKPDPTKKDPNVNGIQAWAEKGIVGRGVLLDFDRWRRANNVPTEMFQYNEIPLKYLKATAESQGTEIRWGDILFIRVGYISAFNALSKEKLGELAAARPPSLIGVERSTDVLEWIWNNFSAVAGDHPAFEAYPPPKDSPFTLHEVLLSGWGCPIGELFDLDKLAKECEKQNRWSFFVSSEVCNVPGAVASPPNILAIF